MNSISRSNKLVLIFSALTLSIVLMFGIFSSGVDAQAAREACLGAGGTWSGSSCDTGGKPIFDSNGGDSTFKSIINVLLFVVGAIAVLMLIIGAIRYVISAGDAQATQNAKNTILYALIGLILAFAAFAIAEFVVTEVDGSAQTQRDADAGN